MAMNSVNTNVNAMVALQALNRTNDALGVTQKRISTGFRVADARDDGAAFAVAQTVRADIAGLTSANEQLGGVKGILDTALAGLTKVSETMIEVRSVLVKLADGNLSADQRTQYEAQYVSLVDQITNFIDDATYNNGNLLDDTITASIVTTRNENGDTYTITGVTKADLIVAATPPADAAAAQAALAAGGNFRVVEAAINDALNAFGAHNRYVDAQITYNKEKIDSLQGGIGALVDADLARESAQLQALQIRQQLGTQALSIANQSPQTLLSLFR